MFIPKYRKKTITAPDGAEIHCVIIGDGPQPIVTIPGAGDGFQTVHSAGLSLAYLYRKRAQRYQMAIFSRRDPLPPNFSFEQHADDMIFAVQQLGWQAAVWECNSAGGPIGQQIAVKYPNFVTGLVLTAAPYRTDEHLHGVLTRWLDLIAQNRWGDLMLDTIAYTYRPQRQHLYRPLKPLLAYSGRRGIPGRLENVLRPLLKLDHTAVLPRIACPTLVIDGAEDRLILQERQREMAQAIPNSHLVLCPGYGHGNEIENPAYQGEFDQFVMTLT